MLEKFNKEGTFDLHLTLKSKKAGRFSYKYYPDIRNDINNMDKTLKTLEWLISVHYQWLIRSVINQISD